MKLCLQFIAEISNRMKPKLPKIQAIVLQISDEFETLGKRRTKCRNSKKRKHDYQPKKVKKM